MKFLDRHAEMRCLQRVMARSGAALVVVWGRRRIGKSRLLVEWCRKNNGAYWVADESAAPIQRRYLAAEIGRVFPDFGAVAYPDWDSLFQRLSREAGAAGWPGPLILDEFPCLVQAAAELPSILQRWIDREKREGTLTVALAGSSQRMMMSTILNSDAPLYGRADEIIRLAPIPAGYIGQAFASKDAQLLLDYDSCWGGIPRYWELAQPWGRDWKAAVDELALSPLGPLHDEADRLLRQEIPSAISLRPILDAVGLGANRSVEIAGRLETPATSLTRGLRQLQQLGYIRRDTPYGESEKNSKRAVYKLADPFLRLWFRVIAPHRGTLQSASKAARRKLLTNVWPQLRAEAWEDLCRQAIPRLEPLPQQWLPAKRHWIHRGHEWDAVSVSLDGETILLGECKSLARKAGQRDIDKILRGLMSRHLPSLPGVEQMKKKYVIFLPALEKRQLSLPPDVHLVDGRRVFEALTPESE